MSRIYGNIEEIDSEKIKKFFQKERHALGLILHINYRAYKQNVRGI